MNNYEELAKLAEAATPGPWEFDTTKSDGEYGSDDNGGRGYDAYVVMDARGRALMDSLNRDDSSINIDGDSDGNYAWDELGRRDAAYIAAANPAAILALLADRKQLAERVASLEATEHHIRNMTLEEAALECIAWGNALVVKWQDVAEMADNAKARAWDGLMCAHSIRALKSTAPQPVEAAKGGEPVTRLDVMSLIRSQMHRVYASAIDREEVDIAHMQHIEGAISAIYHGRYIAGYDARKCEEAATPPAPTVAPGDLADEVLQTIIEAVGQARNQCLSPTGTRLLVRRMADAAILAAATREQK